MSTPAVSDAMLYESKSCNRQVALLDEPLDETHAVLLVFAGAEVQATKFDADAAQPAWPARALRSRRGHADAAPTKSAQGSAGSQQFPSPPKTRAGRKRYQAASKPAAASTSTRRGKRAAQEQAETADQDESVQQPDVDQQSVETDAFAQRISNAKQASVAHSPIAVLATASSLEGMNEGHSSDQQPEERMPAEASPACLSAPVDTSHKSSAEDQAQASELGVGSTSKHRKRKQSAVGESLAAPNSKRRQPRIAQQRQTDSPDVGSRASAHQYAAQEAVSAVSPPRGTDNGLQSQPDHLQTLEDGTDVSSLQASEQQHPASPGSPAIPVTAAQSLTVPDSVPEGAAEPNADASDDVDVAAPTVKARSSDYQDAQERLSSPVHVSPEPASSQGQQPGKPSPSPMQEDKHQSTAVSPSRPDVTQEQEAVEAADDAPAALHVAPALPASANVEPEEDTLVPAESTITAEVEGNAAAAGSNVPDAGSNIAAQPDMPSVLGAAAAVPLPSSTHTEGMPADQVNK